MKIVINNCWGGFSLSEKAHEFLGIKWSGYGSCGFLGSCDDYSMRADSKLIECVETLGEEANGEHASLEIIDIPDYTEWWIDEHDGKEKVVFL